MHQGIAPAVDGSELVVLGAAQDLGVLPQQHSFVEIVAMGRSNCDDVINSGGGMHLVAQGIVTGHTGHEGLDRRNRHDGVNNQAHL